MSDLLHFIKLLYVRYQYKFLPRWRVREIQSERTADNDFDRKVRKKRTSNVFSCFRTMKWEDDSMLNESSSASQNSSFD